MDMKKREIVEECMAKERVIADEDEICETMAGGGER